MAKSLAPFPIALLYAVVVAVAVPDTCLDNVDFIRSYLYSHIIASRGHLQISKKRFS